MDIKQLRLFIQVAEVGSLSGASRLTDLSQPSIGRVIRQLETELKVTLFRRTGRGVVLTEAGLLVQQHARTLLDDATALEQALAVQSASVSGSLAFGLPPSIGVRLTGGLVEQYRQAYPKVHLSIFETLSGDLQERLLDGSLNLAILYGSSISASLATVSLGTEDLQLICRSGQPEAEQVSISFREMLQLPLILPGRRHGLRALLEQTAFREALTFTTDIEVDSLRVQLELVSRGLGYTILPSQTLKASHARDLVAVPIVAPTPRRQCVLAWSRDRALAPAAGVMRELVVRLFGQN
ncbi:LysR family transcriptional regulator [Allohahella marinimesophila]|uniref:LysR substrate-binding domain-containing protein n=1 Tax=Allohahella marinimesophila TaxID=1054972 RepID=A0ABP7PRK1_9GAMM